MKTYSYSRRHLGLERNTVCGLMAIAALSICPAAYGQPETSIRTSESAAPNSWTRMDDWNISPSAGKYLLFSDGRHEAIWVVPIPQKRESTVVALQQPNGPAQNPMQLQDDRVDAMVNDLQRIRDSRGSVVAGAFGDMAAPEAMDSVFREELTRLANGPVETRKEIPDPGWYGNRPLPLYSVPPEQLATMEQPFPAVAQPLQPLPMRMPATAHFTDFADGNRGIPKPALNSREADSLRRIARMLDQAAADLEDLGRVEEADDIRSQAQGLRISSRGLAR